MKSSSIRGLTSLTKLNINPREYRDAVIHDWDLKDTFRKQLGLYMLRKVSGPALLNKVVNGEIVVNQEPYSVIWVSGPAKVKKTQTVLLSLRYCDMLNRGYALIKTDDNINESIQELRI